MRRARSNSERLGEEEYDVRISWDNLGERVYEAGIDRCVLYVGSDPGVPWNGVVSIQENPTGGAPSAYYFEGQKYLQTPAPEEFAATITAFTYPDAFGVCDGSEPVVVGMYIQHQPRKQFGLSYRTLVANDVADTNFAYKIHLIYNALAAPAQRDHKTLSDQSNISNFVWNITTVPQEFGGFKSSAHVIIDTRFINAGAVALIENILYGDSTDDARIPSISELMSIIVAGTSLTVIDNGDGTYTVLGPDSEVFLTDPVTIEVDATSVVVVSPGVDTISSE